MSIIHPPLPTAPTHVFPFVISPCLSFGGVHFLSLTQISCGVYFLLFLLFRVDLGGIIL